MAFPPCPMNIVEPFGTCPLEARREADAQEVSDKKTSRCMTRLLTHKHTVTSHRMTTATKQDLKLELEHCQRVLNNVLISRLSHKV